MRLRSGGPISFWKLVGTSAARSRSCRAEHAGARAGGGHGEIEPLGVEADGEWGVGELLLP